MEAAQFIDRYGYIAQGEAVTDQLCKRTELLVSFRKSESQKSESQKSESQKDECLFFDADGTLRLDTYARRISSQSSSFQRASFAFRCFTGDIFRETLQKTIKIFAEEVRLAQACVTWNVGEEITLQKVRNRARRLQILEKERSNLFELLKKGVEAQRGFVSNLSTAQKCAFTAFSYLFRVGAHLAEVNLPEVLPLPFTAQKFIERYIFFGTTQMDIKYILSQLVTTKRIDVSLKVIFLQKVTLPPVLGLGERYGTLYSLKEKEGGVPLGDVYFVREKEHLIAICLAAKKEWEKALVRFSQTVFFRDQARTIHIRRGYADTEPENILKERFLDPTQGPGFRVSLLGTTNTVVIKDSGLPPALPDGCDRAPEDINSAAEFKDAFSLFGEINQMIQEYRF